MISTLENHFVAHGDSKIVFRQTTLNQKGHTILFKLNFRNLDNFETKTYFFSIKSI